MKNNIILVEFPAIGDAAPHHHVNRDDALAAVIKTLVLMKKLTSDAGLTDSPIGRRMLKEGIQDAREMLTKLEELLDLKGPSYQGNSLCLFVYILYTI